MQYTPNYASNFLANLGTFWSVHFAAQDQLLAITKAGLFEQEQAQLNSLDALSTISRFDVPVFHKQLWSKLQITASASAETSLVLHSYDETTNEYGGGIVYGQSTQGRTWKIPVPANLKKVGCIVDRPVDPTVWLVPGVDFILDTTNHVIELLKDPFLQFTPTAGVDEELSVSMWLFGSDMDLHDAYNQFGFVFNTYAASSSDLYRDLVNAIWDTHIKGSHAAAFRAALGALVGVPVVKGTELVESIIERTDRLQVITDANVYEFKLGNTATVAVGDTVNVGDFLTDAVVMLEGQALEDDLALPGVVVDNSALLNSIGAKGTLTFVNYDVDVTYTVDADVHTLARFPIGGRAADVDAFWDYVHVTGKAAGNSMAMALRTSPGTGEPHINDLPLTINPMRFLLGVLKHNAVFVVLKAHLLNVVDNGRSLYMLRKLLPAHVSLLSSMEYEVSDMYNETSDLGPEGAFAADGLSSVMDEYSNPEPTAFYVS